MIPTPTASKQHLDLTRQALPVQGAADLLAFHIVKFWQSTEPARYVCVAAHSGLSLGLTPTLYSPLEPPAQPRLLGVASLHSRRRQALLSRPDRLHQPGLMQDVFAGGHR